MEKQHICFWMRGGFDSTLTLRAQELGNAMAGSGWLVSYIADDIDKNQGIVFDWADRIVRIKTKPFTHFTMEVRQALSELAPDFVHILNPSPKHVPALIGLSNTKLIADFEDSHPLVHQPPRQWLDLLIERWALNKASNVVAVSRFLQERFHKLGRPDTGYVPYAVLPRSFPNRPSPFNEPTAVWMGSFTRRVELLFITEIAAWLKENGYKQKVMMIGGGKYWDEINEIKSKHGLDNLLLTGRLSWDDMLSRLKHAYVLLLPLENNLDNRTRCPFKALQYAQAARPILANRVGEVPFLLGEKPHYVDFEPASFGSAIAQLAIDPKPHDVDYSLDRHTWADRAHRLVSVLEDTD